MRPFPSGAFWTSRGEVKARSRIQARPGLDPGAVPSSTEMGRKWCLGADSNHRHADFQSAALPTELPRPGASVRGAVSIGRGPGVVQNAARPPSPVIPRREAISPSTSSRTMRSDILFPVIPGREATSPSTSSRTKRSDILFPVITGREATSPSPSSRTKRSDILFPVIPGREATSPSPSSRTKRSDILFPSSRGARRYPPPRHPARSGAISSSRHPGARSDIPLHVIPHEAEPYPLPVIPHAAQRRCGTQATGYPAVVREPQGAFRSTGSRISRRAPLRDDG